MNVDIDLYGRQYNVDANNLTLDDIHEQVQQEREEAVAKHGGFPPEGTIFKIENQLFKITYVNYGKKRISAIWFNDKTKPFEGLPEIDSSCSIYGIIYKVTFHNAPKGRITLEPIE